MTVTAIRSVFDQPVDFDRSGIVDSSATADLDRRIAAVVDIATRHANAVDREARFPIEAITAARDQHLFAIMVPREFGGEGASVSDIAELCYRLASACSATAMIYAMHQASMACIVRHGAFEAAQGSVLRRLVDEQTLVASSTTEGQKGADIRSSSAALEWHASHVSLERSATVLSYAEHADAIISIARRSPAATASDQSLGLFFKQGYRLEPLVAWDSLGMRGTCSSGFNFVASCPHDQILPEPYARIHARTMMPVTHLLWASTWAGIAADAVRRAQACMRTASRRAGGTQPPGASHYTRASASLRTLRALVATSLARYEAAQADDASQQSLDFQASMNLLKVTSSELAIGIVMGALQACGLSGYRNDGEFSVARHIRDILSSSIMINNERILGNVANAALMSEVASTLAD